MSSTSVSATVTKDPSRSSDQWEQRADGKWYRREYYKVEEEEPLRVVEVWDRLFVGSFEVSNDEQFLRSNGIGRILVLGDFAVTHRAGINVKQYNVNGENIHEYFNAAIDFIKEGLSAGQGVLVICSTMVQYCPIIIIVFFIAILGWSIEVSIERVQIKLNVVITRFQIHQITIWERSIRPPPPQPQPPQERKRNIRVYSAPIPSTPTTTTTTTAITPAVTPIMPVVAPTPVYTTYNSYYVTHPPVTPAYVPTTGYYYTGAYNVLPSVAPAVTTSALATPAITSGLYSTPYSNFGGYYKF